MKKNGCVSWQITVYWREHQINNLLFAGLNKRCRGILVWSKV